MCVWVGLGVCVCVGWVGLGVGWGGGVRWVVFGVGGGGVVGWIGWRVITISLILYIQIMIIASHPWSEESTD